MATNHGVEGSNPSTGANTPVWCAFESCPSIQLEEVRMQSLTRDRVRKWLEAKVASLRADLRSPSPYVAGSIATWDWDNFVSGGPVVD